MDKDTESLVKESLLGFITRIDDVSHFCYFIQTGKFDSELIRSVNNNIVMAIYSTASARMYIDKALVEELKLVQDFVPYNKKETIPPLLHEDGLTKIKRFELALGTMNSIRKDISLFLDKHSENIQGGIWYYCMTSCIGEIIKAEIQLKIEYINKKQGL